MVAGVSFGLMMLVSATAAFVPGLSGLEVLFEPVGFVLRLLFPDGTGNFF